MAEFSETMLQNIANIIQEMTLEPGEDLRDVMAGGKALGRRRARLLFRDLIVEEDVPHCLSLFCWWGIKPALMDNGREMLLAVRRDLFEDVRLADEDSLDTFLAPVVPDSILAISTERLFELLRTKPINQILNLPREETLAIREETEGSYVEVEHYA